MHGDANLRSPFYGKTGLLTREGQKGEGKSQRQRERFELALPVRVEGRESPDNKWIEMSRLVDVTPFGARLTLKRPIETGRLLLLTLPMPRPLRCFDHVEDQYRVWSLVRNVKLLDPASHKGALVQIGVAFVGKRPPRSFEADPSRRYDIARSINELGLPAITEESGDSLSEISATDKRKETRHNIPVEVLVEVIAPDGSVAQSESTVTENISRQGAAIFTTLELSPGEFVKLTSQQYQSPLLAVVRNRHVAADGIVRLHLEFVGCEWEL
jgi:PilZ domain-containing protein